MRRSFRVFLTETHLQYLRWLSANLLFPEILCFFFLALNLWGKCDMRATMFTLKSFQLNSDLKVFILYFLIGTKHWQMRQGEQLKQGYMYAIIFLVGELSTKCWRTYMCITSSFDKGLTFPASDDPGWSTRLCTTLSKLSSSKSHITAPIFQDFVWDIRK